MTATALLIIGVICDVMDQTADVQIRNDQSSVAVVFPLRWANAVVELPPIACYDASSDLVYHMFGHRISTTPSPTKLGRKPSDSAMAVGSK